ncbi:MAG: nickel pincer cofactor biosynthesis protein LarC [Aigarchaeota archaeon]|nr:nickel pincer cofactor biosynthesis protein LarC [Aigarchaeota archaeon]MDW8092231.1 nickel pincer cofactor biosynthesis protein LarC [Nitrososphaerota archaeon]
MIVLIDASNSGVSGDMLLGALIDLGGDVKKLEHLRDEIRALDPLYRDFSFEVENVIRAGIRARLIRVSEGGSGEVRGDQVIDNVRRVALKLISDKRAQSIALNAVNTLLEAECRIHGSTPREIHFHELSAADTIFDVVGFGLLLEDLNLLDARFVITPIAVGGGQVTFSHGTFAVPAPAVMEILTKFNMPFIYGPHESELATPTGTAILAALSPVHVADNIIVPERIGYGAGERDFPNVPNVLRLVIGKSASDSHQTTDEVVVLETNLDDVTGEVTGHLTEKLLASGAKDVTVVPTLGKKGRPAFVLQVISDIYNYERLVVDLMRESGTLGVRVQRVMRVIAERTMEEVSVEILGRRFTVRVKRSFVKGRLLNVKPEFEDLKRVSEETGLPLREVQRIVERALNLGSGTG